MLYCDVIGQPEPVVDSIISTSAFSVVLLIFAGETWRVLLKWDSVPRPHIITFTNVAWVLPPSQWGKCASRCSFPTFPHSLEVPPTHPTSSCWCCSVVSKIWINLSASILQQQQLRPTSHCAAGRRPVRHIPSSQGPVEQSRCYDDEMKRRLAGCCCLCGTADTRLMGRCCSRRNILIGVPWLYFPSCSGHLSGTVGFCWRCTEQNLLFSVLEKKGSQLTVVIYGSNGIVFWGQNCCCQISSWDLKLEVQIIQLNMLKYLNSSAALKQEAWPAEMNRFDAASWTALLLRDTVISDLLGYQRTALQP